MLMNTSKVKNVFQISWLSKSARHELALCFPGFGFSVVLDDSRSYYKRIEVRWTDGPSIFEVGKALKPYSVKGVGSTLYTDMLDTNEVRILRTEGSLDFLHSSDYELKKGEEFLSFYKQTNVALERHLSGRVVKNIVDTFCYGTDITPRNPLRYGMASNTLRRMAFKTVNGGVPINLSPQKREAWSDYVTRWFDLATYDPTAVTIKDLIASGY